MRSLTKKESCSSDKSLHSKEDPFLKLRHSALKIDERSSDLFLLRNSFSSASLKSINFSANHELRASGLACEKQKSYQTLKSTLDILEDKINSAKTELDIPITKAKKQKSLEKIKEKDEQFDSFLNSDLHDSHITQKTAEKKFFSSATYCSRSKQSGMLFSNVSSPRQNLKYYISQAVRGVNEKNSLILQHISSSIRMIKACEMYEVPHIQEIQKVNLKKKQRYSGKKTLVLDLDQTLIHCVENLNSSEPDITVNMNIDGTSVKIGINIRPYALTFLKKMASKFQIIVFTASHFSYADTILDEIDPEGQIFSHRLYRHHCYVLENELHVKDLRILNRNLSEVVLVDNAAYSYSFQLENGIPILPFYEGKDSELAALEGYLAQIEEIADVRQLNKKTFKLHHYSKFSTGQDLIDQLYIDSFQ